MYAEVKNHEKNVKAEDCKSGSVIEYDRLSLESEEIPFTQTANFCKFPKGYAMYSAVFSGYEWGSSCEIYLKNDRIFFAFVSNGAEACLEEKRIYYNIEGKIIKILIKSNDCIGNEEPTITSELKKEEDRKAMMGEIDSNLSKIKKIIK
ncbi:MAG: hypothetical protein ACK452_17225 [Bacteroidota bacterium]